MRIYFFVLLTSVSIIFNACKEESEKPMPAINNVSPAEGRIGAVVTITGQNFGADPSSNIVKFNDVNAVISSASKNSIVVNVPEGATTGPLTVVVDNSRQATFPTFTILAEPPVLDSFSPATGKTGTNVVITGKNFSANAAGNIVAINGSAAEVTQASQTSLTVNIPANASTGKISVTINGATATSTNNFTVLPEMISISPKVGAVNTLVTITGTGFGVDAASAVVNFNGTNAQVLINNGQTLTVKVPQGATSGLVTVTSSGNTAAGLDFEVVKEVFYAGGAQFESGFAVAVDGAQNAYVAGSFQSQVSFGSTVLTGVSEDGFLTKYNAQGEVMWVKHLSGQYNERVDDIVLDSQGNIYLSGYVSSPDVTFGSLTESASGTDGFVARVNANGDPSWIKAFNDSGTGGVTGLVLDASGALFVTGSFSGAVTIGTTALASSGNSDIVVAKINKDNGNPIWAKAFGGDNDDAGMSIAVSSDAIYVGGGFFANFTAAGLGTTSSLGGLDGIVIKLDLGGVPQWVKQIGGANWDNVLDLAVDQNGDCAAGGYFTGSVNIPNLTSFSGEDIFLTKLSAATGAVVWTKSAGSTSMDHLQAIAIDNESNIYATGYIDGASTFDNLTAGSSGKSRDIFVAKYSNSGNILFVKSAGAAESDGGEAIGIDNKGIVYVTGSFRAYSTTFGVTDVPNAGNDDIFLWKIWP